MDQRIKPQGLEIKADLSGRFHGGRDSPKFGRLQDQLVVGHGNLRPDHDVGGGSTPGRRFSCKSPRFADSAPLPRSSLHESPDSRIIGCRLLHRGGGGETVYTRTFLFRRGTGAGGKKKK